MKLAAITDEISQDFERALDVLVEHGAAGAELRGLWGVNIGDLSTEQTNRARLALHQRGLKVCALASPFFKCDLDFGGESGIRGPLHLARPRGLNEQLDLLQRCCDLAHLFECRFIRVFAFWRKSDLTDELLGRIVQAFQEPLQIAARHGITLLLENEHSCNFGTGVEVAKAAKAINSPHLKVVWDPGNAFAAGERPYPDGYEAARPYIAHIHIKDGIRSPDGKVKWCVVGEGKIDYEGQFAALKADGYDGYISLESHYRMPDGSSEPASRACLTALQRFIGAENT